MIAAGAARRALERSASLPPPDTEAGREDYEHWRVQRALNEMVATWCRRYLIGRTTREAQVICEMANDELMRRRC
jgi:hypothetical protein